MFKKLIMPLFAAALFSPFMYADVEGSVGVSSDYFYRGISQNDGNPAVNLELEWSRDGFYAGTWTSNVDFGSGAGSELDLYLGFAGSVSSIDYDIGYVMYTYPSTGFEDSNFSEIYLNTSFKNLTLGVALNVNSDIDDDQAFGAGDIYTYSSYTFDLPQEYSMTLTGGIYTFDENEYLYGDSDYRHLQVDISKSDFTFSVSKATKESGNDDVKVLISWSQSF